MRGCVGALEKMRAGLKEKPLLIIIEIRIAILEEFVVFSILVDFLFRF